MRAKRKPEPWPSPELPNLDHLDDLGRGEPPPPEPPSPHDTRTAAKCLVTFPPLNTQTPGPLTPPRRITNETGG